jgi:3-phenylpropionate/trans-cinnamate dioxygenase ferredoxin component
MTAIRVASTADLPAGKMKKVNAGGKDILIANVDGVYCALNDKCPHLGGSLSGGTLKGDIVTCPRHGAQFSVRTGEAVGKAKIAFIQTMPHGAEHYEVRVEGVDVIVEVP